MAPRGFFQVRPGETLPAPKPVVVAAFNGFFVFQLHRTSVRIAYRREVDGPDLFAGQPSHAEWQRVVEQLDAHMLASRLGIVDWGGGH